MGCWQSSVSDTQRSLSLIYGEIFPIRVFVAISSVSAEVGVLDKSSIEMRVDVSAEFVWVRGTISN